jgi:hypothetical protein
MIRWSGSGLGIGLIGDEGLNEDDYVLLMPGVMWVVCFVRYGVQGKIIFHNPAARIYLRTQYIVHLFLKTSDFPFLLCTTA